LTGSAHLAPVAVVQRRHANGEALTFRAVQAMFMANIPHLSKEQAKGIPEACAAFWSLLTRREQAEGGGLAEDTQVFYDALARNSLQDARRMTFSIYQKLPSPIGGASSHMGPRKRRRHRSVDFSIAASPRPP